MIYIKLENGDGHLHEDMELNIQGMTAPKVSDRYWWMVSLTEDEKPEFNKKFVDRILDFINQIREEVIGKMILFPFDISDQSSGFIIVKKLSLNGNCNLFYADSYWCGGDFNPWTARHFNISFKDIVAIRGGIVVKIDEIIAGLNQSIDLIVKGE